MNRWIAIASACVVVSSIVVSAERLGQDASTHGGGPTAPPQRQGSASPEVQQARADLDRDVAESKRLQDKLKMDRKLGNRDIVKQDEKALKASREAVKHDRQVLQQLAQNRPARGGGGRAGGDGQGRGGRGRGGA